MTFRDCIYTDKTGFVTELWSAAMKGKPEEGICFVTSALAKFYS